MAKFATGLVLGFAAVMAGMWVYSRGDAADRKDAGEVIFSNSPVVG